MIPHKGYEINGGRDPMTNRRGFTFVHKDYDGSGPDYHDPRFGWAPTIAGARAEIDELEDD